MPYLIPLSNTWSRRECSIYYLAESLYFSLSFAVLSTRNMHFLLSWVLLLKPQNFCCLTVLSPNKSPTSIIIWWLCRIVFLSINIRTKDGVGDAGGNKDEDYDGGEDCQAGRDPREGVLAPIHPITRHCLLLLLLLLLPHISSQLWWWWWWYREACRYQNRKSFKGGWSFAYTKFPKIHQFWHPQASLIMRYLLSSW